MTVTTKDIRAEDKAAIAFKNAESVKSLRRKKYWTRVAWKWCKSSKSVPQFFIDAICAPLRQGLFDEKVMKEIFITSPIKEDNFLGPSLSQIYNGLGVDLDKIKYDIPHIAYT